MRTIKSFLYLFLFFSFVFQSCSIEKRRYTNGYSLQWKKNNQSIKTNNSDEVLTQKKQQPKMEDVVAAFEESARSLNNIGVVTASTEKKKGIVLFAPDSTGCDTLVMRNETEIKAKIIEITPTEIKYKYCDNVAGPTYVSYRYEVSYIKYANGRLDSFKDEFAPIKQAQNNNQANYSYNSLDNNNWMAERVNKKSVLSMVFGFISLVPFFGIPAIFIGLSNGLKALRLIKKNDRELGIYKQRAFIGIALAAIVLIVYIVLWVYLLWKAGLLPKI
ncbi:MAG TPA: hypothetical protein VNX01_01045 [Bacteroidia bacterium]|nr:hypothetical protein [Bacteroidia bacterium]